MSQSSLDLSSLNGSNGFVINGIDISDQSGFSVSGAGDINGDGIDDLIIGAYLADPDSTNAAGESYIVFGSSNGFNSSLNLSDLNGSNGFTINGIDISDQSGFSVSSAGDVNGDGIDDLIIGAFAANPNGNNSGESYVVFGSSNGFSSSLNLSDLNGSNGFTINGIDPTDQSGVSVSSAGDVNGDGIDDLIIGARAANPDGNTVAGESYVVFGNSNGFSSSLNLSDLDGNDGFTINGVDPFDQSGFSVSGAGDINGDGIDDVIIGAMYADPDDNDAAGESYVVFGSSSGFDSTLNLSTLNGSNGFVIHGIDSMDQSGRSVSNAGDINGDGIDDLIIGALGADPDGSSSAGESYVVFGSSNGFSSTLNLSDLDGNNGFTISGIDPFDQSGYSVSSAGDVNGDGIDDLIIGARAAGPNGNLVAGESYVVFGNSNGFSSTLNLSNINGSNGFAINGINLEDQSGFSVSGAGDVNGDGLDDLIVGAPYADPGGNGAAGESYVIFGFESGSGATEGPDQLVGTPENDTLEGLAGDDLISGGNGADVLDGGLDNDTLLGETGNDTLLGNAGLDLLQGGGGSDSLSGGLGNDTLEGQSGNDTLLGDAGLDLLQGGGGSDSLSGGLDNDTLEGQGGNDTLLGNDGADSLRGGSGSDSLSGGLNNDTLEGQGGNDTLLGGSGNDSLIGASGSDRLQGGGGDDVLGGGGNNDTLEGQAGNDTLRGNSGFDSLAGAAGNDLLQGGLANDSLNGGSDNDTLEGQSGFDVLLGGSGNDILVGGSNNDTLTGGIGADTYRFDTGFNSLGTDTITDFASNDVLELSQSVFDLGGVAGTNIVASEFATVNSLVAAENSAALIVYNRNTGDLFFNANGSAAGLGTGGQFAQLENNFNLMAEHIELTA
ncbi:Bifunctional hemolysin/adenylate cyclase [Acaryochloris thomasi RCC1774]|uniref:Bifunctional hemolysin/adenylate cyclase n=1 Tax=Acaryochloris thomasi RCC1774 TaxID=1764569 RepID=A0A2W1JIU8_9CYAN|nr:FG-GAP repeat protein [Acaryochloris thomasi]PZD73400.1 Bifunctional hemolysin/adenylate cyclase [Acaryochloris thomasi RCC1774]